MGRSPRLVLKMVALVAVAVALAEAWYWLGSRVEHIPIPFTHDWLALRIGSGQEDHDSLLRIEMTAFAFVLIGCLYWFATWLHKRNSSG
jgi:hypothetical protein